MESAIGVLTEVFGDEEDEVGVMVVHRLLELSPRAHGRLWLLFRLALLPGGEIKTNGI